MHHGTHPTFETTHDFLTYGAIGLELDRANERRERDWEAAGQFLPVPSLYRTRRWLGNRLIALGKNVAGAPAAAPAPH